MRPTWADWLNRKFNKNSNEVNDTTDETNNLKKDTTHEPVSEKPSQKKQPNLYIIFSLTPQGDGKNKLINFIKGHLYAKENYFQLDDNTLLVADYNYKTPKELKKHVVDCFNELCEALDKDDTYIVFRFCDYFSYCHKKRDGEDNDADNSLYKFITKVDTKTGINSEGATNCFLIINNPSEDVLIKKFGNDSVVRLSKNNYIIYSETKITAGILDLIKSSDHVTTVMRLTNSYSGYFNRDLWEWFHVYLYSINNRWIKIC